jgi:Penicillin-insensitive murein endopeptidase
MRPVRAIAAAVVGVALGVAALAAAVVAATAGGSPPRERPPAETRADSEREPGYVLVDWRDRSRGLAVRRPASWTLSPGSATFGQPALCFELSSEPRRWEPRFLESHVEPGGVEIRIAEAFGGPPEPDTPAEPFTLERLAPPGAVEWTKGGVYAFRKHGRSLYVGVLFGDQATPETRFAAEATVQSLLVSRSGRCAEEPVRWRRSRARGLPHAGRLVGGVQLPAEGRHFFTWDPVLRRAPNRPDRRWGAAGVVRITLRVVASFATAFPDAPRVGIGDLSRPGGGDFGPKHASHQNGLDVDVYYPRKDGLERGPRTASQVDRRLAQALVDRFVAAGATRVFVGPNVRLTGPRRVVQVLPNHDNHLHARFPAWRA